MTKIKKYLLSIGAISLLSGCTSTATVSPMNEDKFEQLMTNAIEESILEVEKAKQEWRNVISGKGNIEPETDRLKGTVGFYGNRIQNELPDVSIVEESRSSQTLDKRVNMRWKGDAQVMLRALSQKLGYDFKTVGSKKAIPVNFYSRNESVRSVLERISGQLGNKADIKFSTKMGTITMAYK